MIFAVGRGPNFTPVARHFHRTRPVREERGLLPHGQRRPGLRPMWRLGFGALTPKEDLSIAELFKLIARGPLNSRWLFPDTGFITNPMYPQFWLLGRGRRVAFPELTIGELSGWFSHPIHNGYLHSWLPRGVKRCLAEPVSEGGCFRVANVLGSVGNELVPFSLAISDKSRLNRFGFDYFVKVLSVRKRLGVVVARELGARLRREPTEQELKQHLHNSCHPRVAAIALKGWKDQGKRNYLADEELVVTAALTAILSGTETLILTWDTDVFDQFVKLMEWLVADYAAFRFAEVRYHNPQGCPMYRLEVPQTADGDFGFRGDVVEQLLIPRSEGEGLPPYSFTPVHAYCVLLGNNCREPKISTAAFCLETEMASMLETKGATGGKNTSRFPGKNVVVGTQVKENELRTLFLLGEETYVNYEGVTVSWADLQHALKSDPLVVRRRSLPE